MSFDASLFSKISFLLAFQFSIPTLNKLNVIFYFYQVVILIELEMLISMNPDAMRFPGWTRFTEHWRLSSVS